MSKVIEAKQSKGKGKALDKQTHKTTLYIVQYYYYLIYIYCMIAT